VNLTLAGSSSPVSGAPSGAEGAVPGWRPAIRMSGVTKSFGSKQALDGAALEVTWGEVHALLGENGAGKSTLMNVLAGFYAADAGEVLVDGKPVAFDTPSAAAEAGIGMIHQHFKLVGPLTVLENIRIACARPCGWHSRAEAEAAFRDMAGQLGFALNPRARVDKLSVSDQQKLEILKVLLIGARILIMDEPTAVLAETEAAAMLDLARRLAGGGRAVILITHKMRDVTGYADRVTVMRGGKTVLAGVPAGSLDTAELARAMVGGETARERRTAHAIQGAQRLELRGIATEAGEHEVPLRAIDLKVHGGEIFGIAGLGGNGQSELLEALIGLRPPASGEILFDGATAPPDAAGRREAGLRFVPADRFGTGLFAGLSVQENLALPRLARRRPERRFWVARRWMRGLAAEAIRDFEVAGAAPDMPLRLLSGGNAQKLMLAREFAGAFSILVVHSPTRGLDIRATAAVQARLLAAAARGVAVLLISEDLDEVLDLSDRVAVMSHGRLSAPIPAADVDRAAIGRLMLETH